MSIVETAVECEHCGEYTAFGVQVPSQEVVGRLRAALQACLDEHMNHLGGFNEETTLVIRSQALQRVANIAKAALAGFPLPDSAK